MEKNQNLGEENLFDDDCFFAFWDFAVSPYALGDILTWNVRSCVEALKAGKKQMDVSILLDPKEPSNIHQKYINGNNYHKYIYDMFPAFLVNPMLRNINFLRERSALENLIGFNMMNRLSMFPGLKKYMQGYKISEALYSSHDKMNSYYEKHGALPRLHAPESIQSWAGQFLKSYRAETFFVCVHMRHRRSEPDMTAELFRDANFDDWIEFFRIVEEKYPDVMFIVVGRLTEWPRELFRLRNVLLLKTLGYGLLEELAMVQACDLFMATNSGPAVMAVFGQSPYVIFQHPGNANVSAKLWGVQEGSEKLPFAVKNQTIEWGYAKAKLLVSSFEEKYNAICPESFNKRSEKYDG
jgi:hypothetical protein